MHFAAQFRAATGLRPHEYLLRRRIGRAQEMLLETGRPVADIALSVGFQTQSHFTAIFKRFTGQPPLAWRQSQPRVFRASAAAAARSRPTVTLARSPRLPCGVPTAGSIPKHRFGIPEMPG